MIILESFLKLKNKIERHIEVQSVDPSNTKSVKQRLVFSNRCPI